jgi:cytochrome c oxidase subunit II
MRRRLLLLAAALALTGCAGVQSALSPAGAEAVEIDPLFWTVTGISALVTGLVTILLAVAIFGPPAWRARLSGGWIVWGGGIVFPVVVLSGLFVYGLIVLQAGATRAATAAGPGVTIIGKRWWWDVVYTTPDGREIRSANELRLPVGRAVAIRLESDNVIHSFWAPRLAGKLDMIPGRTNVLTLEATEPGASRGQCAEYCGGAHALMAFWVVALPQDQYDEWLEREAGDAREPQTSVEARGRDLFLENGCGACHAIRGTGAEGVLGPDLTHVGGRLSLAAAALPNTRAAFATWLVENGHIKPENLMPEYRYLEPDELDAISAYLESLE